MIIYTNDLKAGVLGDVGQLIDGIEHRTVHFLDDNEKEIKEFVSTAQMSGISSLRVVQVTHPDAKRQNPVKDMTPRAIIGDPSRGDTVFRYYSIDTSDPLRRVLL